MKKTLQLFLVLFFLFLLNPFIEASKSQSFDKNPLVAARLIANTKAIIPGRPFKLGIELTMQPGWHTYYKEPGDAGMPTKIIWQLPPKFASGPLIWQTPIKFSDSGITTYGYAGKTLIASEITPPAQLKPGDTFSFSAQVKWLSCKDICVPGKAEVNLNLPVILSAQTNSTDLSANTEEFQGPASTGGVDSILTYFAFAFLGGFLLNFMPCVLPVVAIKILGLLEKPDKDNTRKTAIAFSCGILSSFLLLGLFVISLQSAGHKIGWGFQFQQPIFIMIMASLVLLFALSLLGLFDFSFSFGEKTVGSLAAQEGFAGDFFKGVMATILSTPCTAPFLGTALGFAFVEPWTITLTIFAAVGVGMCLPYLVLIIAPQYLRFLPKPGNWMAKLKEAFGFVLLATVMWLISIMYYQVPPALVVAFCYFLLSLAFAAWLLSRFTDLCCSNERSLVVRSLALLIVILSAYFFIYQNRQLLSGSTTGNTTTISGANAVGSDTQSFDPIVLDNALKSGKTVFLDFTAKWCLTCQLNENAVINNAAVQNKFRALNVLFLQADWTRQDPTVTNWLRKFERSGVPLYVIYPGKSPDKPIILPELLTTDIVLSKLDEAGPSLNKK